MLPLCRYIVDGAGTSPKITLVKNGAGTQILSGANTYSGGTTINGGTIQIGAANNLPGALTLAGGTLAMSATMGLANNVTVAAGQSGTLRMIGATSGTLTGNYSGVAGTLDLDASAGSGFSGFIINSTSGVAAGSTVRMLGAASTADVQLQINDAAYQDFFANAKLTFVASGTGATYIQLGNGATSARNIKFGALDGGNATTGINSDNRANTVTITGTADGNYTGKINNGGGSGALLTLVKTGAGTQTLSGANTYTGGTTVNGGKLVAGNAGAFGSGVVAVNTGGTLDVGGFTLTNALTVNGGTLAGAAGSKITGVVTVGASGVVVASGASLTLRGVTLATGAIAANGAGLFANSGTLTLDGTGALNLGGNFNGYNGGASGSYTLISGTFTGTFSNAGNVTGYDTGVWSNVSFNGANGTLVFTAVPEPSTYGLLGAGALAAVAFVRRRRKVDGIIV